MANRGRIGIFGGTFDPIHLGHLILAEEACAQLGLEAVYFVPAGDPPHKQHRSVTAVEHRVCMVELATVEDEHFGVSLVDARRPGPHYATDMVRLLQAEFAPSTELHFLMGMDSLRDLPGWHKPEWLLANCRLVALPRPDYEPDMAALERVLPGVSERLILLEMPLIEISSTVLRARVRAGQTIHHQVPRAVEAYIKKNGLYLSNSR
ncbi:MAG TPA: nicotinate-nucleotide adenylyltransferase [Caldilineaceae bacterium]|nr:nicotinate-nucleotide adenylyltransferase [Caldilineaceae bacterium]